MMRLSDFELDEAKLQGVWWDFATASTCKGNVPTDGGCFLIAPLIGNDGFHACMDGLLTKHSATLRDKDVPEPVKRELRRALWAEATAKHVLRGWVGWEDLAEFSEAKAVELLTSRKWLAVSEFVARACGEQRAAMQREEEDAKGN